MAGTGGGVDHGIWGLAKLELRGGCPGARRGGRPPLTGSWFMGFSVGVAACGGHAVAAGDWTAAGAGGHDVPAVAEGDDTICPQLGHGPETPASCAGTVKTVRQKPHWN